MRKINQQINSSDDIQYYFDNNRFKDLLKETKKYKDMYCSKEAALSLILSFFSVFMLLLIVHDIHNWGDVTHIFNDNLNITNIKNVEELIKTLLTISVGGLFGVLSFIIGGLSILSGTVGVKLIDSVNDEGKIKHLIKIMFNFYYAGALIGVTIVMSIFSYMVIYTSFQMTNIVLVIWSLIISYFIYLTIITCIMLMGTSLRFFILNYWYYLKNDKK